jgi:very-short-patch-repair endonuclease
MRLDEDIASLAERQHACVATWQLRDLGAQPIEITRLRRASRWECLTDRVLRVRGSAPTDLQLACAATLEAGPDGALSHQSAAALWGIGGSYRILPAHVAQLPSAHRDDAGLAKLRQVVRLSSRWLTQLDGIAVVRPELCVYQLCATVHPKRAERALDTAWSMGLLSGRSARACLNELAASGRNGTVLYRELLDERGDDYTPTASGLEARFQEIAREHGYVTFDRQVDIGTDVWIGRVDFLDRDVPLIVEVQSERFHRALSFAADDATRRARLEAAGFVVVEIWDAQVWHRPHEVTASLRDGRLRARQLAA